MNSILNWKFTRRMICTLLVVTIKIKFSTVWNNTIRMKVFKVHFERRRCAWYNSQNNCPSRVYTNVLCCFWMLLECCLPECYCFCYFFFTFVFEFYGFRSAPTYTVHVPFDSPNCSRWISIWRIVTVIISRRMLHESFHFLLIRLFKSITSIACSPLYRDFGHSHIVKKLYLTLLILCWLCTVDTLFVLYHRSLSSHAYPHNCCRIFCTRKPINSLTRSNAIFFVKFEYFLTIFYV